MRRRTPTTPSRSARKSPPHPPRSLRSDPIHPQCKRHFEQHNLGFRTRFKRHGRVCDRHVRRGRINCSARVAKPRAAPRDMLPEPEARAATYERERVPHDDAECVRRILISRARVLTKLSLLVAENGLV